MTASTNSTDPHTLLDDLDPILGQAGSIRSAKEVQRMVSVMKDAQLLVSKCVILNIVKATKIPSTLEKFMEAGGWAVLNMWLVEAKKSHNFPLMVEILQVLQKLPVTVAALKQGSMGKLIKQLSKTEHPEVKGLAGDLLASWMSTFREGQSSKVAKGDVSERPTEGGSEEVQKPTPHTKEKKEKSKKKDSKSKAGVPPIEASQPPPGPLVALGKPKEKTFKRPRDLVLQKGQVPPEKKIKTSPGLESKSKGPVESQGFMKALSTQAAKMKEKRVKKLSKVPPNAKSSKNGDGKAVGEGGTPTNSEAPQGIPSEGTSESPNQEEDMEDPGTGYKKKKRVSWAEDDNLVIVHYFQMDESERATLGRKSFLDAAQHEKLREREALEAGLMFSRDRLIEMAPWQRPIRFEGAIELVERGADSEQKKTQREREEKVLAQLFLSKSSLPSSAAEPDPEPEMAETEPKLIPLLEPNATEVPPLVMAGPGFTHIGPGQIPPDSPLQSPGTTIHQAQYFPPNNPAVPLGGPIPPHGQPPPNAHQLPPLNHMQFPIPDAGMPPGNYYNYQEGFPPGPDSWGGGGGGGYYGDPMYFRGRGGPPLRRGIRGGFRARGRGFFRRGSGYIDSRICKHFLTHGCKLGIRCKFLHCTPEELASKIAQDNHAPQSTPPVSQGQQPAVESMDTSNNSATIEQNAS